MSAVDELAARFRVGQKSALARAISWAENGEPQYAEFLRSVYGSVGRAWRTGVTGPPGAGKSTLVNELARVLRAQQRTVGILAVDPSSPISGGALLGDRIRMEERTSDAGVYIRSMASRGGHGGCRALRRTRATSSTRSASTRCCSRPSASVRPSTTSCRRPTRCWS